MSTLNTLSTTPLRRAPLNFLGVTVVVVVEVVVVAIVEVVKEEVEDAVDEEVVMVDEVVV